MNERIKELAEQAFNEANNGSINNIKIPKEFVEKFAELIVKECATAIEKDVCHCPDDHVANYFDGGLRHSVRVIKQHFGVEE